MLRGATTRTEPFKEMAAVQVIMTVAGEVGRPQLTEEASSSPDIVPLVEKRWNQDPVHRPEGFGPVMEALASVIHRVDNSRNHSAVIVDVTSSGGTQGGSCPRTANRGVDAPQSVGDDTADKSKDPAFAESVGGRDVHTLDEEVARRAAKLDVVLDEEKTHPPCANLPVGCSDHRSPRLTSSAGLKKVINRMT